MIKRKTICRVCTTENLEKVLDFGMTPLANSYVDKKDLDKPELFFPLQVNKCRLCDNLQLAHVVDPEIMFKNYLYASSTSPVFVKHFEEFAEKMGKKEFVVDIGSNDGILLKPFQDMGCKVLGVEPAENIKSDVPVVRAFFTTGLAKKIVSEDGKADLITATNVFAHIDDLDEIVNGVKILLKDDGVFVVEVTDAEQMLKDGTFDLIYHEHVNYWTDSTIRRFFSLRGMQVSKIEKVAVHGGSLRVYARVSK